MATALTAAPAAAHGFGQRFDLPLPLHLWVAGAGASIVFSFVVVALFVRAQAVERPWPTYNLLRLPPVHWLAHPTVIAVARLAVALVFLLTIAAGLFGAQDAYSNLIVTMVWVIWWVGIAFVSALIGDVWSILNPIRTIFLWLEQLARALGIGDRLPLVRSYPRWLGMWPALLLFGGFAWAELVWGDRSVPRALAIATIAYSALTWAGMATFGRDTWLRHGDAFAVAFGILARFAPLAGRTAFAGSERALYLRVPGSGLLSSAAVSWSFMTFVLLMLSTVTFDGFLETPLFRSIANAVYASPSAGRLLFQLSEAGLSEQQLIMTGMLIVFPLIFLLAFLLTSWAMVRLTRMLAPGSIARNVTSGAAARSFVLTLVPIAVAYHLSHYFSFLVTTGQFIIPLASDPFGFGWDLFGTATYRVKLGLLSPYVFWYSAVAIIIVGHVVAVYLAHVTALRVFGSRRGALVSQIPMVTLMVAYTTTSLWILAQPIVS